MFADAFAYRLSVGWSTHNKELRCCQLTLPGRFGPQKPGLDKLPAWFLRLAAPAICGLVADVINVSLLTSSVPRQWEQARIRPIPKVPTPLQPAMESYIAAIIIAIIQGSMSQPTTGPYPSRRYSLV